MRIQIFSIAGYSHLYRSLLRFCNMSTNEAKSLVYRLNTANLDSARYNTPGIYAAESTPYTFSSAIERFECRPYRTEVQLYKSLCALDKNIMHTAITDEQKEALAQLLCIISNVEYRFYKTFGVEIYDELTVYSECAFGLMPREDEPSVCMMNDWLLLPSA